ncbi:MAG: hypothetical protein JKY65_18160, partial [Planctomycetes bacterium]|nr:hypothetical protein [Planctomycetota bacterium]
GAPALAGAEITGVYDYSAVVSLDDPDGPARVLTFTVTTERKLKGFEASTVSKDSSPFADRKIDFASQSLVIVVRPGSGPPPVIESVAGTVVRYSIPPLGNDPSKSDQGRFTARVVSPAIKSATFELVEPPK